MSIRHNKLLLLATLVVVCATTGCSTGRVNLWPLYFRETCLAPGEDKPVTTTELFYPLVSKHYVPEGTDNWLALRPLGVFSRNEQTGQRLVQYLWPLGAWADNGEQGGSHRFLPLYSWNKVWDKRTQSYGKQGYIFPFTIWGRSTDLGGYFAVFPLGGVTRGLLGPLWSFAAFPLYSHYERGDYVRNDFLYPFFGYGSSPDGKQRKIRFWPLYVTQRMEDSRESRTTTDLLWPFVRWGRIDKKGSHYWTMFKLTPLFSGINTHDRSGKVVARRWQVLGWSFHKDGWSGMWGMLRNERGPKTDHTRFWPFYIRKRRYLTESRDPERADTHISAPWPIVWYHAGRTNPHVRRNVFVVAPLYWHSSTTRTPEDAAWTVHKRDTLFPLTTWGRDHDGTAHLWFPSHGWDDQTHGAKRSYRAFIDIFQYHNGPQGSETRLLWRLLHHRSAPTGSYLSFGPLFTWDSTAEVVGEDGKYVSFLFGLVKRSWTPDGGRWRLFYIPFP